MRLARGYSSLLKGLLEDGAGQDGSPLRLTAFPSATAANVRCFFDRHVPEDACVHDLLPGVLALAHATAVWYHYFRDTIRHAVITLNYQLPQPSTQQAVAWTAAYAREPWLVQNIPAALRFVWSDADPSPELWAAVLAAAAAHAPHAGGKPGAFVRAISPEHFCRIGGACGGSKEIHLYIRIQWCLWDLWAWAWDG